MSSSFQLLPQKLFVSSLRDPIFFQKRPTIKLFLAEWSYRKKKIQKLLDGVFEFRNFKITRCAFPIVR